MKYYLNDCSCLRCDSHGSLHRQNVHNLPHLHSLLLPHQSRLINKIFKLKRKTDYELFEISFIRYAICTAVRSFCLLDIWKLSLTRQKFL